MNIWLVDHWMYIELSFVNSFQGRSPMFARDGVHFFFVILTTSRASDSSGVSLFRDGRV